MIFTSVYDQILVIIHIVNQSVYCSHAVGVKTTFIYSVTSSSARVFAINPPASASSIDLSSIAR